MKRWYVVSAVSIILTIFMVALWLLIPGFPLLIFLFFPPLFWWGSREAPEESGKDEGRPATPVEKSSDS